MIRCVVGSVQVVPCPTTKERKQVAKTSIYIYSMKGAATPPG